jgi:hypothetical protein
MSPKLLMMPIPPELRPRVGLSVEPRLLRDALEVALTQEGVTVVDLRDGARCDILLATDGAPDPPDGTVVVRLDEASSRSAGLLSVSDVLGRIDGWRPHAST